MQIIRDWWGFGPGGNQLFVGGGRHCFQVRGLGGEEKVNGTTCHGVAKAKFFTYIHIFYLLGMLTDIKTHRASMTINNM